MFQVSTNSSYTNYHECSLSNLDRVWHKDGFIAANPSPSGKHLEY